MSKSARGLVVAAVLILLGVYSTAVAQTTASAENTVESNLVTAKIWLDQDQIPSGATVRVWLSIENNSSTFSLSEVALDEFDTPGFDKLECWRGISTCGDKRDPADHLPGLAAGARFVTSRHLLRNQDLPDGGKVVLTGSLSWTWMSTDSAPTKSPAGKSPGPPQRTSATVSSTPIELLSTAWYKSTQWAALRDLVAVTVPIWAAIIAWGFSAVLQRRTERQVVFSGMLDKVIRDAEHHLTPIYSAVGRFIGDLEDYRRLKANDKPAGEEQLLFGLLLIVKRRNDLKNEIGAYYLKLQAAESVAASATDAFSDCLERHLGCRGELDRVTEAIGPTITFGGFQSRLEVGAYPYGAEKRLFDDVAAIRAKLPAWLARDHFAEEELLALKALKMLLNGEIDRAFAHWYERPPRVDRATLEAVRATCEKTVARLEKENDPSASCFRGLLQSLEEYRTEVLGLSEVRAEEMR
jgi:hypothetical protein